MRDQAQLRERITFLRKSLERQSESAAGFIALPSTHRTLPQGIPLPYQEFLREADGLACGDVLLFQSDDILKQQSPVKEMPGGRGRWFCIGSLADNPLFIELRTLGVYVQNPEADSDPDDSLGLVDYFLLTYVFGPEYKEFAQDPCDDPWLQLLESLPT